MTANALDSLFLPLDNGLLKPGARVAVLNAHMHPALKYLKSGHLSLQQFFKPFADVLQLQGFASTPELPNETGTFDTVFVAVPKNIDEARYLLASGLMLLRDGGALVAAAANDAGGGRLKKIFTEFGLQDCSDLSKNKARTVWGRKVGDLNPLAQQALQKGQSQMVMDGAYLSQPGIFGWDKIDRGSEILLQHLKGELSGKGADFGCGYGYLSRAILQQFPGIKNLHCIDADWRAVQMCRANLEKHGGDGKIQYHWQDLTRPASGIANLDWVIMNPPFHEGKKSDIGIGQSFIDSAFLALHKGGALWMVANAQLPYEAALQARFHSTERIFEGSGFKIFCARK